MATDRYLLVATPTASSPCFCVYFTLLQQVACDKKKKPHITPSSSTNTSYMNIIGIGMNRASPLLSGQAVVSWAETSHTRSNVISLLLDLLNSCWVRYAFYEVMIQKYSEWGHNLQLIMKITVLVFGEWDPGGTSMRCVWAHVVSAQVHLFIGCLSLLHCFCVPQTFNPHWLLSGKCILHKWNSYGLPVGAPKSQWKSA